jgi:hypothetical protein
MDTQTYQRECLFRHPAFRQDVLAFYQQFPRMFRLWPRVATHLPRESFPAEVQPLIHVKNTRVLWLIPRTFEEVIIVMEDGIVTGPDSRPLRSYQRLGPESSVGDYFQLLDTGDTRDTYQAALASLLQRWPTVPSDLLRWGRVEREVRPSFVAKPVLMISGVHREWVAELTRLADAREVRGFIPVYDETTRKDVGDALRRLEEEEAKWARLRPKPRPKRRQRPDQYEARLHIWDAYHNCGSFAAVARTLRRRPSTVKGIYLHASRDILGETVLPKRRSDRLLQGFDPATHTQSCPRCQRAARLEDMCIHALTYARQDERSLREQLHAV